MGYYTYKIVSLHDVEKHAFVGSNILDQIIVVSETTSEYDFTLALTETRDIINKSLLAFKEEMSDATERLIDQMEVAGVFK